MTTIDRSWCPNCGHYDTSCDQDIDHGAPNVGTCFGCIECRAELITFISELTSSIPLEHVLVDFDNGEWSYFTEHKCYYAAS